MRKNKTGKLLRPLRLNLTARRPLVREVLKKDLVNHREGDKFLSSAVKHVAFQV
jgi:hypothetical protein